MILSLPKKHRYFSAGIFFLFAAVFLFTGVYAFSANVSESANFYVEKNFDASARDQLSAELVKVSPKLYFYIEKLWWNSQPKAKQEEILVNLNILASEFDAKIYPTLTSVFGSEWNPGVDGDSRITLLFHAMNINEGGYFRTNDEYIKLQLSDSNEREMLYFSLNLLSDSRLKTVLAHEFTHLITFNQKNKKFGVEEETWLNEARADYSAKILGYENNYAGSNLQQRVKSFVENPSDSITEWRGLKYDYSSVSLFTHYLADHYGVNILFESLKSKFIGIESINYALKNAGYKDDFSQIFTNWTIAVFLNNCSIDSKYCYLTENLKNLRLLPQLNFLPLTGNVSLSVTNVTKNWMGNWLKFIGGNGDLQLDFSGLSGLDFKVPYILEDNAGVFSVNFLELDNSQKGKITVNNFGTNYKSLIIMPSLQSKIYNADGFEPTYPFTYKIVIVRPVSSEDQQTIDQLLEKIAFLKQEIAKLQAQKPVDSCYSVQKNLYFGIKNSNEVKCLQQFLKNQGQAIYPEGLVTGNFGSLTMAAVIRFQEKYASEILLPLGLNKATGFVGALTRAKINQLGI